MLRVILEKLSTPEGMVALGAAVYPFSVLGDLLILAGVIWAWRRRRAERFARDQEGVVAIEAAILLPVLTLMFAVAFFAGLGTFYKGQLAFATQQASIASVNGADPQSIFASNIPPGMTSATVSCNGGTCNGSGAFLFPFASLFGASDTITLTASATAAGSGQ
jgi:Flp pilus assembly pilin Flp